MSSNKIVIIDLFQWHSHAHDSCHAPMQHTIRNFLLKGIMGPAGWWRTESLPFSEAADSPT